jgi:hypothetical protein
VLEKQVSEIHPRRPSAAEHPAHRPGDSAEAVCPLSLLDCRGRCSGGFGGVEIAR